MVQGRWQQAKPTCFWLDDPSRPAARPAVEGFTSTDLLIIGGGFTGLWAGVQALQRFPERSVVIVDGDRIASNASGRNGGFCSASLTHGDPNGRARWPDEMANLRSMGAENLAAIQEAIVHYQIDCDLQPSGELDIATAPWQEDDLRREYQTLQMLQQECSFLEGDALSREFNSPLASAGLLQPHEVVLVNPAKLAWGLARVFESLGGTLFEHTRIASLREENGALAALASSGVITANRALVATAAFPALVTKSRGRVVPVYDYVLMSEPLTDAQIEAIGWSHRRGVSDAGNQFHYLRLSADNRILFGGYEAVYRFNQQVSPKFDQEAKVFSALEEHFDAMFPSLVDIGFSHRWGGAIDTSTRFAASVLMSHHKKVATVNGFTGLGVGASRFFAGAALDRLDGASTPATSVAMIRKPSIPFPPEPIRYLGISATRKAIASADLNNGKRGLWLRLLDRLGLGFDS